MRSTKLIAAISCLRLAKKGVTWVVNVVVAAFGIAVAVALTFVAIHSVFGLYNRLTSPASASLPSLSAKEMREYKPAPGAVTTPMRHVQAKPESKSSTPVEPDTFNNQSESSTRCEHGCYDSSTPSTAFTDGWEVAHAASPDQTCDELADALIYSGAITADDRYDFKGGCDAGHKDKYGTDSPVG